MKKGLISKAQEIKKKLIPKRLFSVDYSIKQRDVDSYLTLNKVNLSITPNDGSILSHILEVSPLTGPSQISHILAYSNHLRSHHWLVMFENGAVGYIGAENSKTSLNFIAHDLEDALQDLSFYDKTIKESFLRQI